mmetsp:Transcript_82474/g.160858  ORF Transcript_82474/g.160858 Transcript_82474/m.160858 type:complete len:412 (-) Transcript_82474:66-1301(-)
MRHFLLLAFCLQPTFSLIVNRPLASPSYHRSNRNNHEEIQVSGVGHLFVFGAGFVGQRLCELAREELGGGVRISTSCRQRDKADAIERGNVCDDAYVFDIDNTYTGLSAQGRAALSTATHLVVTVPPVADFDKDPLLEFHKDIVCSSPRLRWVAYLSTTGVYGDHQGNWVDEKTLPNKPSRKASIRLAAECEWQNIVADEQILPSAPDASGSFSVNIFRLAGIYGPSRSAIDTVLKGEAAMAVSSAPTNCPEGSGGDDHNESSHPTKFPMAVEDKDATASSNVAWVSRVHVDDICGALLASMRCQTTEPGATIFNVADREPAPRGMVLECAARLIADARFQAKHGKPSAGPDNNEVVVFRDPGRQGAERRIRAARENKRVCGDKLRQDLQYEFRFTNYESGLRGILGLPQP